MGEIFQSNKREILTTLNSIAEIYLQIKISWKRKSKYDFKINQFLEIQNVNGIKREDILRFRDQILEKGKSLQTAKELSVNFYYL